MRYFILSLLFLLTACGRALTPAEVSFLRAMQGDQLDVSRMRLVNGHFASEVTYKIPVRPRTTCQERLWPPATQSRTVTVAPAATVLFNRVYLRKDLYRDDFLQGHPEWVDLADLMLLAHEAVHVWQWQNRDRTGYTPLKALREHVTQEDPYLFDTETPRDFLSFGYEQQGSIVEEYVCCQVLDPKAPRTARLRDMIARHMPIENLPDHLDLTYVRLPWQGAQIKGICR